jgi:hypothetical protein
MEKLGINAAGTPKNMSELETLEEHRMQCSGLLERLLAAPAFGFDERLRSRLPAKHGLYVIKDGPKGECLHAGKSPKAKAGLRSRVWDQHYCGGDKKRGSSDLVQKVMDKRQASREDAKLWIRNNCLVQWVVEEDAPARTWSEHYILSVLQPLWGS